MGADCSLEPAAESLLVLALQPAAKKVMPGASEINIVFMWYLRLLLFSVNYCSFAEFSPHIILVRISDCHLCDIAHVDSVVVSHLDIDKTIDIRRIR